MGRCHNTHQSESLFPRRRGRDGDHGHGCHRRDCDHRGHRGRGRARDCGRALHVRAQKFYEVKFQPEGQGGDGQGGGGGGEEGVKSEPIVEMHTTKSD